MNIINVDDKYDISVSSYIDMALINTVDDKSSRYTCHSYLKAQLARKIHRIVIIPPTKDYK